MKKQIVLQLDVMVGLAIPSAFAQGTIQFLNNPLQKIKYLDGPCAPLTDAPEGVVVGVFYGSTPDSLRLAEPTTHINPIRPGVFNGGNLFPLEGTNPSETVFLKIGAWYNKGGVTPDLALEGALSPGITHDGETEVIVTAPLGPTAGPGTPVFQTSGPSRNRVTPFTVRPAALCQPVVRDVPSKTDRFAIIGKFKTSMKKLVTILVATCCFAAFSVHAQGTIQFLNSALSKIKYQENVGSAAVDCPIGAVVGVFYGATPDSLTLATPTARVTAPGLFSGGTVYALPGTNPGESVYLKIAGWYNAVGTTPDLAPQGPHSPGFTHWGESGIVQTTALGPTAGPGTVVFQGPSGTNPNRARPFCLCIPEPSTWAVLGLGFGVLVLRRRRGQR